ncbi:MAG: hypothetical protein Q9169_002115 [Polycauliona sp. 2 TL-2023]
MNIRHFPPYVSTTCALSHNTDLFTQQLRSMHLMYTVDANGKRLYTLKKIAAGEVTKSAHPARFSPDDKYSRYGISRTATVPLCIIGFCFLAHRSVSWLHGGVAGDYG